MIARIDAMAPGDRLENGAALIAAHFVSDDDWVLLAAHDHEYVTWRSGNANGSTYWGHYFDDIVEATADFVDRCGFALPTTEVTT